PRQSASSSTASAIASRIAQPPNALPDAIEQLMFEKVGAPVASRTDPSTIFHRIARPLSRPATMLALQLWPDGSELIVICDAPLWNSMPPTSLSPTKW